MKKNICYLRVFSLSGWVIVMLRSRSAVAVTHLVKTYLCQLFFLLDGIGDKCIFFSFLFCDNLWSDNKALVLDSFISNHEPLWLNSISGLCCTECYVPGKRFAFISCWAFWRHSSWLLLLLLLQKKELYCRAKKKNAV